MSWWIAVPLFFASWFFAVASGAGPTAIENERNDVPENERSGVSIAPIFPLFPLIAWLIWGVSPVLVANVIVGLHIVIVVISIAMSAYYMVLLRRLRSTKKRRTESK